MGIFGNRDILLGKFKLVHYPSKEMTFESDLRPGLMIPAYGCYLDKIIYNLAEKKGTELLNKVFALASSVIEKREKEDALLEESRTPIEQYTINATTDYKFVTQCSEGNPLLASAEFWEKKNGFRYIQTNFIPNTYPDTETIVANSCEALFIHMFNAGDKQTKFFLPIFIISQVNWYQQHGFPRLTTVGHAPQRAMLVVRQILQSLQ